MRRIVCLALLPLALVFGGCESESAPTAPPVTPYQLNEMRTEFQMTDPDARVGVITAVLPSAYLVSVGDVPVKDFEVGDIISIMDSEQRLLAMGKVEAIEKTTLSVRYDPQTVHGHNPVVGDIAVRAIR